MPGPSKSLERIGLEQPTMRRSDLVQHRRGKKVQPRAPLRLFFGERQHLLRVLDSLEGTELPIARMQQERRILEN